MAKPQTFLQQPADPYADLVGGMPTPSLPSMPMGGVEGGMAPPKQQQPSSDVFLPPEQFNPETVDPLAATVNTTGVSPSPPTTFAPPSAPRETAFSQGWEHDPAPPVYHNHDEADYYNGEEGINFFIEDMRGVEGVNPSVAGDPGYWFRRIRDTGGLRADNIEWWRNKMMQPEGAPEGGGGPNVGPQPVTPGMNEIGNDPFSQTIRGGLTNLINAGGWTPEQRSIYETLIDLIGRSGRTPGDDEIIQQQMENARENESTAFTGQLRDVNAELANRGLASEPGVPQGEQGGALERITQNLAVPYAGALRDINTSAIQRQNDRLTFSLSAVTGLSNAAASQLLSALGQGTQRQIGLAQIALQTLDENRQWNQFLATYGLDQAQLMYQIQNGNAQTLLPILALFQDFLKTIAGGHV